MPFYAGENKLSQKQFDDSIEISSEQYGQALAHLASGGLIKIHDGQMILTQQPEQLPDHNPPEWIDGEWVHDPKPEPEPEPPQPNWEQFNSVAMTDPVLNNAIAVTMGIAPLAALSLSATLIKAESGKLTEFETAFNVVVQSAQVPNEAIDDWIDSATDNNLPAEFIDILEQSKTPLT